MLPHPFLMLGWLALEKNEPPIGVPVEGLET